MRLSAMQILVLIGTVGLLLKKVKYYHRVTFLTVLSCHYLFLVVAPRSNRWTDFLRFMAKTTCFRARMLLWGLKRWVITFGGIYPKPSPQNGRE